MFAGESAIHVMVAEDVKFGAFEGVPYIEEGAVFGFGDAEVAELDDCAALFFGGPLDEGGQAFGGVVDDVLVEVGEDADFEWPECFWVAEGDLSEGEREAACQQGQELTAGEAGGGHGCLELGVGFSFRRGRISGIARRFCGFVGWFRSGGRVGFGRCVGGVDGVGRGGRCWEGGESVGLSGPRR